MQHLKQIFWNKSPELRLEKYIGSTDKLRTTKYNTIQLIFKTHNIHEDTQKKITAERQKPIVIFLLGAALGLKVQFK